MQIEQRVWERGSTFGDPTGAPLRSPASLVLVFGATEALRGGEPLGALRDLYPQARILGCSTAGEICGTRVLDETIVATAVAFDSTAIRCAEVGIPEPGASHETGLALARAFEPEGLVHVFVLSDGLHVNGSELVSGLEEGLPRGAGLTGGLSGDGSRFEHTLVCLDGPARERRVAALGFYGDRLEVGCGSLGGWDPFGPERLVTRSRGNVLYELDGESALGLYKRYLGEHAAALPASGLLFPLAVRAPGREAVVRTILGVDEAAQSMTFAGDVPEGAYARLMKANVERLIDGATGAARTSSRVLLDAPPDLAILISCVGRKLVLKQRIEEEVESVRDIFGPRTALAGFYSYGEISPFTPSARCELHNQTMTITTFRER
jgi:hypothetical protein